jgi:ZIP family zinc transporter
MLAASFLSLLLPGVEFASAQFASRAVAVFVVSFGFMSGAVALYLVHRFAPHEHFLVGREGPENTTLSRIWLFVIAITLHNFPEGMAVGVGFAGGDIENGRSLALGILVQNLPEGLAVAISLLVIGYSRLRAYTVAFLTGLVEPVGGLVGSALVTLAEPLIPWTLGFAAGAMIFVISDEVIPEMHRGAH